jgi:HSP20 family protein
LKKDQGQTKFLKPKKQIIMTRNQINPVASIFNEVFNSFPANWGRDYADGVGLPKANVHETNEAYHVELLMPGRNKEDFNIKVDNNVLTVAYEAKASTPQDDYKTLRREFVFKSLKRSFTLDENVDADNIQAKYENGVLKLFLPKKEVAAKANKVVTIQ